MSPRSRPRSNTKMEENLGINTCLKMNCVKKGPHTHNNYRNNMKKSFKLSNAVGINENAVTRMGNRNRNRTTLKNNLKRNTRRA